MGKREGGEEKKRVECLEEKLEKCEKREKEREKEDRGEGKSERELGKKGLGGKWEELEGRMKRLEMEGEMKGGRRENEIL